MSKRVVATEESASGRKQPVFAMPMLGESQRPTRERNQAEANSPERQVTVNRERRALNRRLAEKFVDGWSANEYRAKPDDQLQKALDGELDAPLDINAK